MKYFTIVLNKDIPIYYGNEHLKGSLNFKITERLKINSVKIKFKGQAKVNWGDNNNSYHAEENYFYQELFFLQKKPESDLYIEPGEYSYPFDVILPPNLPTSFEHHYGQIRYSIHGTIDIPWAFDKHTKKTFTVLNEFDLNNYPELKRGFGASKRESLCCGPCSSKPITISFELKKAGYVPGEPIDMSVTIDNKTNKSIQDVSVSLVQKITFYAKTSMRFETRKVIKLKFPDKISEKSVKKLTSSKLIIPSVSSSSNGSCKLIEVEYELVLKFDTEGPFEIDKLAIPITIGTKPFVDKTQVQLMPNNMKHKFQESIFDPVVQDVEKDEKAEIIETDEHVFKPFYPYYQHGLTKVEN